MAAAAGKSEESPVAMSIYKAARRIKRRESSLYNALRSIHEDAAFVAEIAALWPALPLASNLRCGLWYVPPRAAGSAGAATCYFKSTDGHAGNWAFSTARLNLHLALLAGEKGGCIIVDSTRKGKWFPDSMSKTIPIWCCVLNRAVDRYRQRQAISGGSKSGAEMSTILSNGDSEKRFISSNWDDSLHLPLWILDTEKNAIEERIEGWVKQFECCGADIESLVYVLKKPLRPLWISQKTRIWLNEIPDHQLWDFTPIILVSASASDGVIKQRMLSEFSWQYIPGAGDDEESWARGLSPMLFWKYAFDIIDVGPDRCNQLVAEIVERDRVYHAQRGEHAPQVTVKVSKLEQNDSYQIGDCISNSQYMNSSSCVNPPSTQSFDDMKLIFWIGPSNLAVCSTLHVSDALVGVDCVLNCDGMSQLSSTSLSNSYLHLQIVNSKHDRFSLFKNIPCAIEFAKVNLIKGKKLLVCCQNGEDISICVALAILNFLFDDRGYFDSGNSFMHKDLTKWEMRRRLVFICKYAVNARPSRGNLKQVYGFLSKEKERLSSPSSAPIES